MFKMANKLKIDSYNCAGFKYRNFDYLKEIYIKCDILLLQETWLYNFKSSEFTKVLKNCNYHAVSAMDEANIGRVGRPYGGCAIVWHKKQGLAFAPIVTNSPRVCAVTIISNDINVIVISVYMPTDDDVNFIEYGDVLHELSSIISTHNNFDIIIGGDLNVDYRRFESKNLHLLQCFIEQEQLKCATLQISANNYTRMDSNYNKSFIDHFIISENVVFNNVSVVHKGHNLSDHDPISLQTNYHACSMKQIYNNKSVSDWDKATINDINNYKAVQNQNINNFVLPDNIINCNNFLCVDHENIIFQKIDELLEILISSADQTIPKKCKTNNSKKDIIPGWNDYVKPYRDKSIAWHNTWKNAGSPRIGPLADARRAARTKYHWAIKQTKKQKDKIILEKTANNLATKSFGQFWQTVKYINGKDNRIASVIDGKNSDSEIVKHFYDIYSSLYSSVKDDDFNILTRTVHNLVNDKCNSNNCKSRNCHNVSSHIVRRAINSLSSGKYMCKCLRICR